MVTVAAVSAAERGMTARRVVTGPCLPYNPLLKNGPMGF
jgi:hypothetical protein